MNKTTTSRLKGLIIEDRPITKGIHGIVYKGLFRDAPVIIKFAVNNDTDIELGRLRLIRTISDKYAVKLFEPYYAQDPMLIDRHVVILEYMECRTLGLMNDYSTKPLREIVEGLIEIHKYISHNDIHISNIVYDQEMDRYKFIDFGSERIRQIQDGYEYDWSCLGRTLKTYYLGSKDSTIIENISYIDFVMEGHVKYINNLISFIKKIDLSVHLNLNIMAFNDDNSILESLMDAFKLKYSASNPLISMCLREHY